MKANRYPKDTFAKNGGQGFTLEGKVEFPKHFEKSGHFPHLDPKGWAVECFRESLENFVGLLQTQKNKLEFSKPFARQGIFSTRTPR